jgi:hypothetical protein
VWIRLHGTIQLIDLAEDITDAQSELMYAMEQYAMEAADSLLVQSTGIAIFYEHIYNLDAGRMLPAPPPMTAILHDFEAARSKEPVMPVTLAPSDANASSTFFSSARL